MTTHELARKLLEGPDVLVAVDYDGYCEVVEQIVPSCVRYAMVRTVFGSISQPEWSDGEPNAVRLV